MHDYDKLYIGGQWCAPRGQDVIEVSSPFDLKPVGRVPEAVRDDVDAAVAVARGAFETGSWSRLPASERIAVLERLLDLLTPRTDELADLQTSEMGAPTTFSRAVYGPGPAGVLASTIAIAKSTDWEEIRPGTTGLDIIVRREPVGVVAAIIPWNSPLFTLVGKVAPALAAGCSVIIKPSPETPLDANVFAELATEAGVPAGVISVIPGGRDIGAYLVNHPGVDKVSFTGSTAAGREIASNCGRNLKRFSLELGGKSAAILLDDVDIDIVTAGLKFASLANSGQACIAQTRILAPRSRYDDIVEALGAMMAGLAVGDPFDPSTDVGPMVAKHQQDKVNSYIELGLAEGAQLVTGGLDPFPDLPTGWFVRPTLFSGVNNSMRIAREEIFGPVLVAIPYDSEEDAIRIANDSEYGLAGSVWTSDRERGIEVGRHVRTGTFGVNQYLLDFNAPFGGFKASGVGREMGAEGLSEYIEYKSITPPPAG
ncbi:aldehyde dehydrogenase [Mycolicibacterium vaccae]|uniref:aldehyde dehydrogenase n=1 Tax=Mycolicibacterium vaccae TaxID=1810 RepID=UPI003D089C45